jgi:uncharacterized protein (TIGR00255 family)
MILSMTGYGKAEKNSNGILIKAELRSLNSRYLDLNLRLASALREKENEVRTIIGEKLVRGKVDVQIIIQNDSESKPAINAEAAKKYYEALKSLAKDLGAEKKNLLSLVMQMPEVMSVDKTETGEEEWNQAKLVLSLALNDLIHFRMNEGKAMEQSLKLNIEKIFSLMQETIPFEQDRIGSIKSRLADQLKENISVEDYDRNRLEQELIYYLERMDFSEEKVRLKSHCDFFLKTLNEQDSNGRRLNFISQEMGREINTLGSKANHAEIQKCVVMMKDELEKIKEQLLNVL